MIDELTVGAMRFRDQPAVLVDRDPHDRSLDDGLLPLHLFARSLAIPFYEDRPPIEVVAPPPPHMQSTLQRFV